MRKIKILAITLAFLPLKPYSQTINQDIIKFSRVLNLIEEIYVDTVNRSQLTTTAIVSMLKELDPHSYYISKEDLSKVNEEMSGSFEGIGVQFHILNDTVTIVSPISGGPSEKVGIIAGDRIVSVDGENIAGNGITNEKVFKMLRGEKGTKVTLGIKRISVEKTEYYVVTRDKIPMHSLDAAYIIGSDIGYIKLNRFSATTFKEYQDAMKDLQKKGAKNLILDLTNNGGGFMNMAVDLANEFLEKDKLIVYSEGLKVPTENFKATFKGGLLTGKLVIMVDEGSASASEIVAGAIQDWDRGVIVGRRTFGKGLVQKQYNLPDASAIRLTIARYHTPTGRVVQRHYDKNDKEYFKDLSKRITKGELFSADSIDFPDSLKYSTLKLGRTVYGGGGIMPDVFVPVDTTSYTAFHRKLNRKSILYQFVISYLDNNRDIIKKMYKTGDDFEKKFIVSDDFINEMLEYAKKSDITPEEGDMERSEKSIKVQLKALLARNLYDQNTFYKVFNELDHIYRVACEIITDNKAYNEVLK
jgi:carboxyl-terminal processing protease